MREFTQFILPIVFMSLIIAYILGIFKKILESKNTSSNKFLWLMFLIFFPFLSVLMFLLTNRNNRN